MYGDHLAGGDIHFFKMAGAALAAGYPVNFIGGHALEAHARSRGLAASVTLTDRAKMAKIDAGRVGGQVSLFLDYTKRFLRTLRQLRVIRPEDVVYATTDYWFDTLPAVWSRARRKMMVWHMEAPSFGQIVRRSRADVDALRAASLHYWLSQNASLSAFARCRTKRVFYVHPDMRAKLLRRGMREEELKYLSFGVDPAPPVSSLPPVKIYDAVWIGRVHRQKGIEDLLATLRHLAKAVPGFKAVIIGKVKSELEERINALGLGPHVDFPGFVSEERKFELFQASRIFLMPSRFEGSPRVIGEALICGLPVVAYAVPTYPAVFGEFLRYVDCFDAAGFQREAERQVMETRAGRNYLDGLDLGAFRRSNSWETTQEVFLEALREFERL
jgi:glycosyltransferase involved in cell wall biosynthesis